MGCRCSRGSATVCCFVVGGGIGMCASISLVLSFGLLGLESFVVPFFPGLGYVANRIPRSCSRSFGFSPSFRLEGLSRLFYGLGFVGVLGSDRVFSSIFSFVRVSRVFLGSATVFVLRRSLESFGVFDPSSSPSGLRDLSFVSLDRVCYGMLLRRLSVRNPFGTSISLVLSRGCFSLVFLRYRAS